MEDEKAIVAFADGLGVGVCRLTFGRGSVLQFGNGALAAMLGRTREQLAGRRLAELCVEELPVRRLLGVLRRDGRADGMELSLRRSGGGTVFAAVSGSVVRDPRGRAAAIDLVVRDISREKEAENDLVRSRELFRVVFENSAAAITVTDDNEQIVAWNPFAEKMLDMTREELFNKPIRDLYPPREWRKLRKLKVRQKGQMSGIATQVLRKDGTALDVDASITVLRDATGRITGAIGILRDITKQKRFQEMLVQSKLTAEEANRSKSMFLARMSHELRTPMNAVLGMLDFTLETTLTDEQRDNLKVAHDAATNLLGLLNDILDLSKAEAGKITIEALEISPRDIVRSVCKGLTVLSQNKGVELRHAIAEDVPELVIGDPVRIRQIIINLVNNAIKFTHKGVVEISVAVASRAGDKADLLFAVQDSGIGIPKDRIGALFEVFSQADESTSRRYGGTGLGLAICKKLAEIMGGRIWVESEEGRGSRFNVAIPVTVSPNARPAETSRPATEGAAVQDVGRLRILLVEDNLVNQKIAARLLEKRGWEVAVAGNGREAVDAVGRTRFDLVLMDDHMPEMTGVEATAIIRTEEKQTGMHVPIIAMTANAMAGDREKYLAAGMDAYVSKPIDRDALFQTIINLVQQRKGL